MQAQSRSRFRWKGAHLLNRPFGAALHFKNSPGTRSFRVAHTYVSALRRVAVQRRELV